MDLRRIGSAKQDNADAKRMKATHAHAAGTRLHNNYSSQLSTASIYMVVVE